MSGSAFSLGTGATDGVWAGRAQGASAGRQSNWLAYFEVYRIGFVFVTPQALGHQFSVDEGHVWLGWGIRSGGRICLIRSQQNSSNVGDGICDFRVHSSSFYLDHRLGQQSSHIGSRLRWGRGFLWLLEGVVTPQTYAAPQLDSFIGVRMEIAEAAFRSPSRTSRAVFLCALAPLSWGYRWLKLYLRRIPSHAVS